MRGKQIIFFEGICGSGKTATANQLHEYLQAEGISSRVYIEGEKNPFELHWHACFTGNEFNKLCGEYPLQAEQIKRRAFFENNYIFAEYRALEEYYFDGELFEKLKKKDFCFAEKPVVEADIFTEILKIRLQRFAGEYADNDVNFIICDGIIFQHQIHDLQRLYNMDNSAVINHIGVLYEQIAAYNPVIIYLTQFDLEKNLKKIAAERDKPGFCSEERVAYYKRRKQIEYEAMSRLKLKSYVIDNSDYDYDKVFDIIKLIIGGAG